MNIKSLPLALFLAVATPAVHAAEIIDNSGSVNGTISPFGSPNTATYGQTFVSPGQRLNSFSLFLTGGTPGADLLNFRGFIGTWTGDRLGSVLWTSDIRTADQVGSLQEIAFNTGSINVMSGITYVAFLSISGLGSQQGGTFSMPTAPNSSIAGNFVFQNNGDNFASLSSAGWSIPSLDAQFKASFDQVSAVPEPGTWALMILGLGFVGGAMRSARRRQEIKVSYA